MDSAITADTIRNLQLTLLIVLLIVIMVPASELASLPPGTTSLAGVHC